VEAFWRLLFEMTVFLETGSFDDACSVSKDVSINGKNTLL